jgi:hypothetical protein
MRHEFAPEELTSMRTFHRVQAPRRKLAPPTRAEQRLPLGQSAAVVAGLSVLSWGIVILLVVAFRAIV